MTHCTKCGHKLAPVDKFCAKCGHPASAEARARLQASRRPQRSGNEVGSAQHEARVEELKAKEARWFRKARFLLGTLFVLLVACAALTKLEGIYIPALFVGVLFLCVLGAGVGATPRMSREEYEALPGALDGAGAHACVFCGNPGLYRSTQYKTTTVRADCSKCKKPLFKESAS